jgi:phosphoserine phosphatase RsbU/P
VMTRSVLRAELLRSGCLNEALQATNSLMWEDLVATEAFITVFTARYEPDLRVLHFANAGHPPALLRHPNGSIEELTCDGMPLGILPSPTYEQARRVLDADDVVLIFSDGVVEASAPDGVAFGMDRLRDLLAGSGDISAADLVARVLAEVAEFQAAGVQEDDITVMALRVATDPRRFR